MLCLRQPSRALRARRAAVLRAPLLPARRGRHVDARQGTRRSSQTRLLRGAVTVVPLPHHPPREDPRLPEWKYTLQLEVSGTVTAEDRADAEFAAVEDARHWLEHAPLAVSDIDVQEVVAT